MQSFVKILIGIILGMILLGGGYWSATQMGWLSTSGLSFADDSYQAVFLSNNQVYFGKVEELDKNHVRLTNIYYLILRRPLQEQTPAEGEATEPARPEYTLVKLGNELHGPKDEMIINRDQVLFVEDLKADSRVVTAINNSRQNPNQEAQPVE